MQQNTVPKWDQLPALSWEDQIAYLTYHFLQLPQTDCPVEHKFEPGVYVREMTIPAGSLFLGRAHRHGHLCQLVSGSVLVKMQDREVRFDAPAFLKTEPGFHMVLQALTDVVGRTVHPNPDDSRDVEALEADIFEPVEALRLRGEEIYGRLALT